MSNQSTHTDPGEFISELDAGLFESKLARALSDVALGVTNNEKKQGKVTVTFTLSRIAESSQVNVAHRLEYKKPTRRGSQGEDDTTSTPMHVGRGGRLTISPDTQNDMFKTPAREDS